MSISSSRQPGDIASARRGPQRRNIYLAASPRPSLGQSGGRRRAVPELPPESIDEEGREERVAREVRHQELIEASFDRAEAHARLGDFEQALDWLDRVVVLSGALPAGYAAQRARWARSRGVATPAGSGRLEAPPRPIGTKLGEPMTAHASKVASRADSIDPAQSLVFELPATPTAASVARRALLAGNGALPAPVRDDVVLLVTELVTNAVRHAGAGPERPLQVQLLAPAPLRGCGGRRRGSWLHVGPKRVGWERIGRLGPVPRRSDRRSLGRRAHNVRQLRLGRDRFTRTRATSVTLLAISLQMTWVPPWFPVAPNRPRPGSPQALLRGRRGLGVDDWPYASSHTEQPGSARCSHLEPLSLPWLSPLRWSQRCCPTLRRPGRPPWRRSRSRTQRGSHRRCR